jgi:hypothetical protein
MRRNLRQKRAVERIEKMTQPKSEEKQAVRSIVDCRQTCMNQNEQTDDKVGVFWSHGSNLSHGEQDDGYHGEYAYDRIEHSLKNQFLSHQCLLFAFENGVGRRRHRSYTVGAVL